MIAKDGCLVVNKRDQNFITRELIVIPEDITVGLLYALHLNLNHPTPFQLSKLIDTRFFILNKEAKIRQITESCTLCASVARLPNEIQNFKPNEMPEHPGQSFTVDVLKLNKKLIMVTVDNFSGFISTVFIKSEKSEDLLEGIILTTSPFRSSVSTNIRVDQAPGFKSLSKQANLKDFNITLELGHAKNKNALALVDKKIKELEDEMKKLSNNSVVNVKILSKATMIVNEKIRHQGLSSKEILFSRDQFNNKNLSLVDDQLAQDKMTKRKLSNQQHATSIDRSQPNVEKGNIVLLKAEGDKHNKRDLYIVLDANDSDLIVSKLPHALSGNKPISFQPHNFTYKVKLSDAVLCPNQPSLV